MALGRVYAFGLCTLLVVLFQNVHSRAFIEIKFLSYSSTCKEDLGSSNCDPKFTFCLDTPKSGYSIGSCAYASTRESNYYQDTLTIPSFGSNVGGIANPWNVTVNGPLSPAVMLVIRLRDDDIFGDDHLATWPTNLTETVYASWQEAKWATRNTNSGDYRMRFDIRIYCDIYYYTSNCSVYCKPSVHFDCNPATGGQICAKGWTGNNCTDDINECSQAVCERGTCENLPGDYVCHCPDHYLGKNCSTLENPCNASLCKNNATCLPSNTTYSYQCNCTSGFEGASCELRKDPCLTNPCQNGSVCLSSPDHTSYSCNCPYPYTGNKCDTLMAEQTSAAINKKVTESKSPTTVATTKLPTSTNDQKSTENSSLVHGSNGGSLQYSKSTKEEGFDLWYVILICALLACIIIIIVACFVVRRRRREKEISYSANISIASVEKIPSNNALSFENPEYNRIKDPYRRPGQILPTTPTDDVLFNPMKPPLLEALPLGASGGEYAGMDDGYVKPSEVGVVGKPPTVERAHSNPYADFKSINAKPLRQDSVASAEENHYQELDEVNRKLDHLQGQSSTDPEHSLGREPMCRNRNGCYFDVPKNLPKLSQQSFSPDDEVFNNEDDFEMTYPTMMAPSAPPAMTGDCHYDDDNVDPQLPPRNPPKLSTFAYEPHDENHYAAGPIRTSDPFANAHYTEDDDDPKFDLPYMAPGLKGSLPKPNLLYTQESIYDNQPSNRSSGTSLSSEYDSPRSSARLQPPAVAPKPKISSPECFKNAAFDEGDKNSDLPLPLLEPVEEWAAHESAENPDSHAQNKGEQSVPKPGLYLENHGFSFT